MGECLPFLRGSEVSILSWPPRIEERKKGGTGSDGMFVGGIGKGRLPDFKKLLAFSDMVWVSFGSALACNYGWDGLALGNGERGAWQEVPFLYPLL